MLDTKLKSILVTDYNKNHKDRDYDLMSYLNIYENLEKTQYSMLKFDNVAIVYKELNPTTVEFHCVNGGSASDLTSSVDKFNKLMSSQYSTSVTYYDNVRINDILKHLINVPTVQKIDLGIDKTYEAIWQLRSV